LKGRKGKRWLVAQLCLVAIYFLDEFSDGKLLLFYKRNRPNSVSPGWQGEDWFVSDVVANVVEKPILEGRSLCFPAQGVSVLRLWKGKALLF
jgi:hypothetical protein